MAMRISLLMVSLCCSASLAVEKPNIIVIYTDDQGYADLGCQGVHQDLKTPHIDTLAAKGMRMTHGYVTAPQCMPSRAGLLTGRYQQHAGVEGNRLGQMHRDIPTIASRLKAAGYVTGMAGKWGVGGGPNWQDIKRGNTVDGRVDPDHLSLLPGARGFDYYFSGVTHLYAANMDVQGQDLPNSPVIVKDERYRVDVQSEAALAFVKRHARGDRPFFLYYAPYAPHVPLTAPQRYQDRFGHVEDENRRICLGMLACIDDGVGRILQCLREQNMEEDTMVWFISDNGAPKNNGSSNNPLAGYKGSLLDGGVRVPYIVTWPGVLPAGTTYDPAVSSLDVLPTLLAVAGQPMDVSLDGVNLLPYLRDGKPGEPHDALFFRWMGRLAIRTNDWKLIRHGENLAFYSMQSPTGEHDNLKDQHPEIVAQLNQRLSQWDATLPKIETKQTPRQRPSHRRRNIK